MTRLTLHDAEVSEVLSEAHGDWPGLRLVEGADLAPAEADVLGRWEAEDKRDLEDLLNVVQLSLAWQGA